ncbi:MAG: hypothetical protein V1847_01245 [Candidatus Diapherotrites archaeon]
MRREAEVEHKLFETFSQVASSLGYSELHGKILAALLIAQGPVSLQDIASKTKYSLSAISLSIDFLEVMGVVKKVKQNSDRKVYVVLSADLLDILKRAVLLKAQVSIRSALQDFEMEKLKLKNPKTISEKKMYKSICVLEKELARLQKFTNQIAGIQLPSRNGK